MTFSYDDVRRLASDPETDWDTLHRIAEEYPELRPAVAANPATYPELLEALADLDDPAVTAALMRRFNPDAADQAEAEADTEVEGEAAPDEPQETPPSDEPTSPSDGDRRDADPRAAGAAAPEVASAGPTPGEGATPTPATPEPAEPAAPDEPAEPAHAGTAAAGAAGAAAPEADAREDAEGHPPALQSSTLVGGAGAGISAADLQQRARRRRSRLGLVLLAVVLPLIAVVAIAALVVMLLGDRSDPQAEPDGAAANEQTASPSEASPSPSQEPSASQTPSPSPTGPTLQELRSAVAELPQNSTCDDVTDDVDVFTAYAELAAEEGSWSAEDDQLVQQTVEDLQAECGALQSAQVHQQLSDQSPAGLAAAAEDMGTGWIEAGFPAADDAAELTSFMMPSGNIRCEIGDRLRCTIVEHDFPAPEGCGDAAVTTYETTLRTTSAPDCEDPLQEADRQVLAYGEETANEYFGCQSLRAGVTCWNQISGEGFTLSRSDHSTY